MRVVRLFLAVLACLFVSTMAVAQTYPNRPIHLIVPYPPGMSIDIMGRLIADKLSGVLGQPVVIDNKAGAGGIIGIDAGAKAAPDGYTLVMISSGPLVIAPWLVAKVPFDPIKDVIPIANLAAVAHVLVAAPGFPAKNLAEFVAWAKAKPTSGAYNYASPGIGTIQHLTMEMLKVRAGINLVQVPYKGSQQAQADIMGGHVPVMFDSVPAVMEQVRGGTLKALAVSSSARSPFLPDVPTVAESGFPGFESVGWIGVGAPAGTPAPIVQRLYSEISAIQNTPDMQRRMQTQGFVAIRESAEAFAARVKSEVTNIGKVIKDANVELLK